METLTVYVERLLERKLWLYIFGGVAMLGPVYFLSTLYAVWFGTEEVLFGFKSERKTFLMLAFVDIVAFLTTLPPREKGRVMQIVMALWTVEMFLVYLATIVR